STPINNTVKKIYDYGLGVGGPIVRDKLWFYEANRRWGSQANSANNYFNQSPVFYQYQPDKSRPAYGDSYVWDVGGPITRQITDKQKLASDLPYQQSCECYYALTAGLFASPEAAVSIYYGANGTKAPIPWNTTWTYAATNRLLIQAWSSVMPQGV